MENQMTKAQICILHIVSAVIPMLILGTMFALHGMYPFGDQQFFVADLWHQYYPFISDFWHRTREGNSFLWSWTAGGGHDYVAHFAYYIASPFNLLALLFPHDMLREVLAASLVIKIGLAGLFMSMYLRISLKINDILLPAFSALYALCAFVLGYYWNIMWMDVFAIMPLVIIGVNAIVTEGRFKLFVISLAMAILINFHIGLFVCIFVAIMFFAKSFIYKISLLDFIKRFGIVAICAAIALGLSAVLLLPTFSALGLTYRADAGIPSFRLYRSFAYVLGNFIPFTPPTDIDGLPNLYSGMISLMLMPVFAMSKKIDIREKIAYLVILVFLVLSVNINLLDFVWNAFNETMMLPFRFSFLASFILVIMAIRAYSVMDAIRPLDIAGMAVAAGFFILMANLGPQETTYIVQAAVLAAVYLGLFALIAYYQTEGRKNSKYSFKTSFVVLKLLLFAVILVEVSITAHTGVETVGTTARDGYPLQFEASQTLLAQRQPAEVDFFRTEIVPRWSFNSPTMYGYDGLTLFSSMANANVTRFMITLGVPGYDRSNRFYYEETTPLNNIFLNMRYIISRNDNPTDTGIFWDVIARERYNPEQHERYALLLRNNHFLPLGFMTNAALTDFIGDRHNPFNSQNELFRLATGLDGDLFTLIDVIHVGHTNYDVTRQGLGEYVVSISRVQNEDGSYVTNEDGSYEYHTSGSFRFNFEAPEDDALLYGFVRMYNVDTWHVTSDNETLRTMNTLRRSYIFPMGEFNAGQIVSLEANSTITRAHSAQVFVGQLNRELFQRGFEIFSAGAMELTYFSDTRVEGVVTAAQPGLLYTSIPHSNNWRVYVNGNREEIISIGGAMAGVMLDAGTHTVEFRHFNRSFVLGVGVSLASLLVFIIMWLFSRKDKNIFESIYSRILTSPNNEKRFKNIFLGAAVLLVNLAAFSLFVMFGGLPVVASNILSWIVAIIFGFIVYNATATDIGEQRRKSRSTSLDKKLQKFIAFVGSRLPTGLVELVAVPLLFFVGVQQSVFGIGGMAAKVLVLVLVIILNGLFGKITK